eukprot:GILK01005928.1.p1 GENE.GILK01005928.1~~GILK01005928.1.p1  ORF type:complete len:390 (-),score=63.85 GILK01005928.1:191-1201(-)
MSLDVDLKLIAVMSSSKMVLASEEALAPNDVPSLLENAHEKADYDMFVNHLIKRGGRHSVLIDCSASDAFISKFPHTLSSGVNIVVANKKCLAGSTSLYDAIRQASRQSGAHFFGESTCGAGLPVLHMLKELQLTGDVVESVEGILSGTLSFIFNGLIGPNARFASFSQAVAEAKALGYTEPDPRDDLGGVDVARKCLILARHMGLTMELEQVQVESLVPSPLQDSTLSVDHVLSKLPDFDESFNSKLESARSRSMTIRYVAEARRDGTVRCGLKEYPLAHSFSNLQGSANVISFNTVRYPNSLVIQGAGAGAEVTAAGVLGDILRLASHLGSRSI